MAQPRPEADLRPQQKIEAVQLGKAQRLPPGQGVPGGHARRQGLPQEGQAEQALSLRRPGQHADIAGPAGHPGGDVRRLRQGGGDGPARKAAGEQGQEGPQRGGGAGLHGHGVQPGVEGAHLGLRPPGGGQHRPGLGHRLEPGLVELQPVFPPAEQRHAEGLLQALHGAGEGGLGDMQRLGGPGEGSLVGKGRQLLQIPQVQHGNSPFYYSYYE